MAEYDLLHSDCFGFDLYYEHYGPPSYVSWAGDVLLINGYDEADTFYTFLMFAVNAGCDSIPAVTLRLEFEIVRVSSEGGSGGFDVQINSQDGGAPWPTPSFTVIIDEEGMGLTTPLTPGVYSVDIPLNEGEQHLRGNTSYCPYTMLRWAGCDVKLTGFWAIVPDSAFWTSFNGQSEIFE